MNVLGSFQPACRPLLRGGLPHTNPMIVAQLICRYFPQTPAWPLPSPRTLADTPFALAAQGLPGVQIDLERDRLAVDHETLEREAVRVGLAYLHGDAQFAALSGSAVVVLEELLRQLNAEDRHPFLLKYETVGPVSLSLALTDNHDRPLAYAPEWRELLLNLCSLRVAWQHEQVQGYAAYRLVMIDEPFLDALSHPLCPLQWDDGIDVLNRLFVDLPARRGLFLSSAVLWEAILPLPLDVIGFHLADHLQSLLQVATPLTQFLADGGCLAWGVTPVEARLLANVHASDLCDRVVSAMRDVAMATGLDVAVVQRQSFLSFTGSLAYVSPAQAEQALQLCAETSQLVRQTLGMGEEE